MMNETQILIGVVGILTAVLGWIGIGMNGKLDKLPEQLGALAEKLHTRLNDHAERITIIETRCDINHAGRRSGDVQ